MSVHSEVNNLFKNKSGNAPLAVRSRSGDTEDGNEYFDMRASTAPNALEIMQEKDVRKARQKFLCEYFALLKQWLNRFEFEFVKQLYVEGRDEDTIFKMLGLSPKRFKKGLQSKLAEHSDEVQVLVARSEWEDAELFSRCFLASPSEIFRNKELSTAQPKTIKGFGNLIQAQSRRERYLQVESDRYYQRKVYMRGYNRGYKNSNSEEVNKLYNLFKDLKNNIVVFDLKFLKSFYNACSILDEEQQKIVNFEDLYLAVYNTVKELIFTAFNHYKELNAAPSLHGAKYPSIFEEDTEIQ